MTVNWGIRLSPTEPKDVELVNEVVAVEAALIKLRVNLQDYVPLLRLNPFRGDSKFATEMSGRRDVYLKKLNAELDKRMTEGKAGSCIQANVMTDPEAKLDAKELVSVSFSLLSGGFDTVSSTLGWGIAVLAQRPDIQEKAHKAIRQLHGEEDILCDANDDGKCTYVVALVREVLRYSTVIRIALPRASISDIVYDGKVIPKGTVFFLNSWACNRGEQVLVEQLSSFI